jgi:phosphohistidine phosphatase
VKRLLLLRHGKAVPADPGIEDHERDLLPRGRHDAPAIGQYMAESGYIPDAILCSTSRRTAETAELVVAELPAMRTIDYVEALYLAAPPAVLAAIRSAAENSKTLLLVGHNPGIERLATALAREPVQRKERDRFDLIEEKFPTAALAVLDFAVSRWRDVAPGQGELIDFVRPRDL